MDDDQFCPNCGRCLGCGMPAEAHELEAAEEEYVDWTDRYRFEREAKEELEALVEQIEGA